MVNDSFPEKKYSKNKIPESNTKRDFSPLKREFSSPQSRGSFNLSHVLKTGK